MSMCLCPIFGVRVTKELMKLGSGAKSYPPTSCIMRMSPTRCIATSEFGCFLTAIPYGCSG